MDRLNALAAHIRNQGGKIVPVLADITDEVQANEIIHRAQQEVGCVNILVNNAGLVLLGLIDGANTEDWRRMVNVNIWVRFTPHMRLCLSISGRGADISSAYRQL